MRPLVLGPLLRYVDDTSATIWVETADAGEEAEIRRDFRHAWEIRTEHFLVKTNHSLERGVEIARSRIGSYGQGFYTATATDPFYGDAEIAVAISHDCDCESSKKRRRRLVVVSA